MGFKVLIAEDDRHTRTILEHIFTKDPAFKKMNIELLLAADGEQALRYFKSHNPDLIISDLLMPKMDGFAFCRAVRASPEGKDTPLVITSAIYKETVLLNRLRDELKVVFFPKPFQVREFTNEILQLINKPVINSEIVYTRNRITMSGPFKGSLKDRSLPAIILDIHRIEGTGVLSLEKGKMTKQIFFQFGRPIGAESNIRHENLGNYLVSKKILSDNQHQQLLIKAKDKRVSFLKSLIDSKQFNEDLVIKYHSSLVKVRIVNAFRWHEGSYAFLPGDSFSERITKAPVDPVALIFAGLKRISDLDQITSQLENKILSIIQFTPQGETLKKEFIRIFGDSIISQIISDSSTVGELLGKGLDPMSVYTHIYIMAETKMIELQKNEAPQSSSSAYKFQLVEDHLNLSNIKKVAGESVEPEEEISIVANIPFASNDGNDSGFILDLPIEMEMDNSPNLHKELRDFYIEIHEKNYFQILGISENASDPEIENEYRKLNNKYSLEAYTEVDLGSDHFKIEEVHQYLKIAERTLLDPNLKKQYISKSIAESEKGITSLDAEELALKGQQLLRDENPQEALVLLEKAVALKPEIGDYHAYFTKALYLSGAPELQFLASLKTSLDLDPESITVNLVAGEINEGLGKLDDSISYYEKALDIQPENEETFLRLEHILKERGAWRILERLHRKLLHLCGNRRPTRTIELAKSLALLYQNSFKDLDKAKAAWEIVLSVMPHDVDAKLAIEKIQKNHQNLSQNPQEAVEDIRTQLKRSPQRTELYLSGFSAALKFDPDLAFIFASILKSLGQGSSESNDYYTRYAPPFLPRAWKQIESEIWQNIIDDDDLDSVGRIFETLCISIPEPTIFDSAFQSDEKIEKENLPTEWINVLEYISHELSIPFPEIHLNNTISEITLGIHNNNFVIFTPSMMLNVKDTQKLCCMFTPIAASYWTGRGLPMIANPSKLLNLLKAILEIITPKGNASPEVLHLLDRIKIGGNELRQQLSIIFNEISSQRGNINITQWSRGVKQSGLNLALVLSNNLPYLIKFAEKDSHLFIYKYAISQKHLTARKLLGLSINI
jgi:CheY-like chemotaxis protein